MRRAIAYGVLGLATELAFTGLVRRRPRTSLWVFPIYALARPLYEPVHDALRGRSPGVRGLVYAFGFGGIEYAGGRALRAARGAAPWDYSHARWHLHGLARADYLPLWGLYGLALETVHDRLARRNAPGPHSPGHFTESSRFVASCGTNA